MIQLRLPASIDPTLQLFLIVQIRDSLDCVTEFNLSSVRVSINISMINEMIEMIFQSNESLPIIGQMINSIVHAFNEINEENIHTAVSSKDLSNLFSDNSYFLDGMSLNHISISSLLNPISTFVFNSMIQSDFEIELNKQANIRERLIFMIVQFEIETSNDLIFQSSLLARLTHATNQLTRQASVDFHL